MRKEEIAIPNERADESANGFEPRRFRLECFFLRRKMEHTLTGLRFRNICG